MGQALEFDLGTKYNGEKGRIEGQHGKGKAGINKGVIGICRKYVPRNEPLPEGDSSDFRQLKAT